MNQHMLQIALSAVPALYDLLNVAERIGFDAGYAAGSSDEEGAFRRGWDYGYAAAHDERANQAKAHVESLSDEDDGSGLSVYYSDMLDPFADRRG